MGLQARTDFQSKSAAQLVMYCGFVCSSQLVDDSSVVPYASVYWSKIERGNHQMIAVHHTIEGKPRGILAGCAEQFRPYCERHTNGLSS